ncbi:hypothetical protein [Virgibacillus ainsalahensis]
MINKRKVFVAGIVMVIILIAIMVFTTPTNAKFDKWILKENGIVCNDEGWNEKCIKDNREIRSNSSHFRNAGIFASYEKNFEFDNGEQTTYRALGIFGNLFPMKNGRVWEILN